MRLLLYFTLGFIGIYTVAILGMYLFQNRLIFQGNFLPISYEYRFDHPDFQEVFLSNPDSTKLNALYFKCEKPSKGLVLYFHGNADNLKRWGNMHQPFTERAYDVFMIDYTGYGKSKGIASEEKLYQNARTAYNWVAKKYAAKHIIIYGRSLGAAVASKLATEKEACLLLLETPFSTMEEVFKYRSKLPALPSPLKYHFSNMEHIPKVLFPVHVFHGTKDWIVPYHCAAQLKAVLKEKDSFTTLKKGTHKNLTSFSEYQNKIDSLLNYACNNYR